VIQNRETGGREFRPFRWGLVRSWATDPAIGNRMINARSETATAKPAFRKPLA
jgi:putative SOS response-associated peptidase YedK